VIALAWMAYQRLGKASVLVGCYVLLTIVGYFLLSLLSLTYGHGEAAVQRTGGALFCFTGAIYYLGRQGRLAHLYKIIFGVWALGAVCYTYFFGTFFYGYLQVSLTQLYGMAFAIFVISRNSIKPVALVNGIALISYPLYLLHQTFGTVGFSKIIGAGWEINILADRAITFVLIILPMSLAIHVYIERRFMWTRETLHK
jgi:peptidoglycan/LPS O-acetylase OafA/YrhL